MIKWEYEALDLNSLQRNRTEIDLLNLAGSNGWELVSINSCNIAILKRALPAGKAPRPAPLAPPAQQPRTK